MENSIKMWEAENSPLIDLYYRKCSMEIVLSSGLLVKDDWSLLGIYMEKVNGRSLASSLKPTLKWGTFGALMLGILLSQWKSYLPTLRTALYTSIPAFVVWRWGSIWTAPVLLRKLKSFLEVTKKVDDRIKNAITIIVDCSLISRGYLLLERDAAIWRTEKPNLLELSRRSQANLPGLRKALIGVCQRLSSAMAEATVELRRKKPLPYNLDHSDLFIPEHELAFDSVSADMLPTTGNLKSAANMHVVLRSEYLKRLFFHFIFFEISPIDLMWNSVLEEKIRHELEHIDINLMVYKPYAFNIASSRDVTPGRPHSFLNELATSSHSMSMHIQEALFSSQELETVTFSCKEMSLLDIERVDMLNHKINHHLGCAGQCIERTNVLCRKSVSKDSPAAVPAISQSITDMQEDQSDAACEERVDRAASLLDLSGLERDPEIDINLGIGTYSNKEVEKNKWLEEEMKEAMMDAASSQTEDGDDAASRSFGMISEPLQGQEMVINLAAEPLAKARAELSVGILSDMQGFDSSDAEGSLSG